MAAITKAAVKKGICEPAALDRLLALLGKYSLPVSSPYAPEDVAQACLSDKKAESDGIKLIIPEKIGVCRVEKVPYSDILGWAKAGLIQ